MAQSKKVKQTWVLFIVTFLVSLIVITYFIKSMSPDVDVEIGGEDIQNTEEQTSESDVKKAIDDRLRWIQMEDNMPGVSKREDGESEEINYEHNEQNKNNAYHQKEESAKGTEKELAPIEYVNKPEPQQELEPPVPAVPEPKKEVFKMSKVYVGSYPTIEQAIQAQNQLMNATVSVSPFVKEVNGVYVLQAGSYADAGKAEAVSREINSLGFHARVVKE